MCNGNDVVNTHMSLEKVLSFYAWTILEEILINKVPFNPVFATYLPIPTTLESI